MGVLSRRFGPYFTWVIAALGTLGCGGDAHDPPSTPRRSPSAVDVTLPAHAADALVIRDSQSRVDVAATLVGARPSVAERTDHGAVYREVFPGAELHHRLNRDGVEDSIAFARAPAVPEVSYALHLGQRSRALRLVENTLEVLDATGAPRLRVAPPFVIDRDGARQPAALRVDGCAVDANPAAPWGRPLTEPGSRRCTLRVTWSAAVRYPAVLDPQWSFTANMALPRSSHVAVPVTAGGNALVLVAGGQIYDAVDPPLRYPTTPTAELYDPVTRTFSVTGSMGDSRQHFRAETLTTGSVLVTGGSKVVYDSVTFTFSSVIHRSAELYDPNTGTWAWTRDGSAAVTQMMEPRAWHTSTMLGDGRVLVTGGSTVQTVSATAEIFDPATGTWAYTTDGSSPTPMTTARSGHSATLLPDGTVLVAGGYSTNTADIFSPVSGQWTATGAMLTGSSGHTATLIGTLVLVNGGYPGNQSELYDTVAKTWRATSGAPHVPREGHTATLLAPGGPVLVAGGDGETDEAGFYAPFRSAELYIPAIDAWRYTDNLPVRLASHAATLLADGRVLVTGGDNYYTDTGPGISSAAYEFDKVLCSADADCRSGEGCSGEGVCALSNGSRCSSLDGTRCLSGICARQATGLFCSPCPTCMELDSGGTTCVPVAASTPCYPATTCSNAVETRRTCDGAGACVAITADCPGNLSCANFGVCRTACTTDGGCRAGYVCDTAAAQCVPARLVGEPCTAAWQCASWVRNCVWSPAAGFVCAPCAVCSEPDSSGFNCIRIPVGTQCGPTSCQGGARTTYACDVDVACTASTSMCATGMTCDPATASCVALADAGSSDATAPRDAATRDAAARDATPTGDATKPADAARPDSGRNADAAMPKDGATTPTDAARPDGGTKPPPVGDAARPGDAAPRDAAKIADAAKSRDAAQLDAGKVTDGAKPRGGARRDARSVADAAGAPPLPKADAQDVASNSVEGGGCGCELGASRDGARGDALAWIVALALLRRRRSSRGRGNRETSCPPVV